MLIVSILGYAFFGFCGASVLYVALFAFGGHLPRRRIVQPVRSSSTKRFAILIPAYKEDAVVLDTVRSLHLQDYPKQRYDVVVIADTLREATIRSMEQSGAIVVRYAEENRTKVKALNAGLAVLDGIICDAAVILDADNIVNPDFLSDLNAAFVGGASAVQCRRVAKNIDTPMAYLDALSEGINNHIFRHGHARLGLSAGLIGSGMAFEFALLKQLLGDDRTTNGFDKALEFALFRRGVKVEFLSDVFVYDEKVRSKEVFKTQRTRWIASQWQHLRKHFSLSVFLSGRADLIDKTVQMLVPPRVLLLALVLVCALAGGLFSFGPGSTSWSVLAATYMLALAVSIPRSLWTAKLAVSVFYVPVSVVMMLSAMLSVKKAREGFLHTPHSADTPALGEAS